MASALDVSMNYEPTVLMSKDEYWQANYAGKKVGVVKNGSHYNDWNYKIGKFFGGRDQSKFESEYEAYLNNVNAENEWKATQSARAWDEYMESTKYQRAINDLEAAGLNPWLAIQSGVQGSGSTSAQKADYKYSNYKEAKNVDAGRNLALFMIAAAKLIAAIG